MTKINFINNVTKANADTFNTMQDNIENGITAGVNEAKTYTDTLNTYSNTETRIGTWIDGKPLYRRVLTMDSLKNNGETKVYYDSTYIIQKFDVYAENPTGKIKFHLPIPTANYISIFVEENSHYISAQTSSDRTAFTNNYVIIEYTKTTD